jgi:hypothetical protein
MKAIKLNEVDSIEQAKSYIECLQEKLIKCEQELDDLVRACEIATASKQFYLLDNFIKSAYQNLEDRIELESVDFKSDITIITDE